MSDLDREITDTFVLVDVLLVFAVAYYSAVWAQIESLIDTPIPTEISKMEKRSRRFTTLRILLIALTVAIALIFLLILPLVIHVLTTISPSKPYSVTRAGLILIALLLLAVMLATIPIYRRAGTQKGLTDSVITKRKQSNPSTPGKL